MSIRLFQHIFFFVLIIFIFEAHTFGQRLLYVWSTFALRLAYVTLNIYREVPGLESSEVSRAPHLWP